MLVVVNLSKFTTTSFVLQSKAKQLFYLTETWVYVEFTNFNLIYPNFNNRKLNELLSVIFYQADKIVELVINLWQRYGNVNNSELWF